MALLPPDTRPELLDALGQVARPCRLLWCRQPDPELERRALALELAGTLPLDEPRAIESALERAIAWHRRLEAAMPATTRPTPTTTWHWDEASGDIVLEDDAPLPAARAVVLKAVRADVEAHRALDEVGAFHHDRLAEGLDGAVWLMVRGAMRVGPQGHRTAEGTVSCVPEQQVAARARHDPLTGLPGRAMFLRALQRCHDRGGDTPAHAVIVVDIDNLKAVNDGLGHKVGDLLLRWAGERLVASAGEPAEVARIGNDEFAVLVERMPPGQSLEGIAHRLLVSLSTPVALAGHLVYPTARAGLAHGAAEHDSADAVLRDAQSALARAKASTTQRYVAFDGDMRREHVERLQLDRDLRRALELDQLHLYYQPIVDLDTGRIQGFEALMRWQHPERGAVSPTEFIPRAEQNGLIIPIGRWALTRACSVASSLRAAHGSDVYVSVNLSPVQLHQPDLVETVRSALREHDLSPRNLRLELTEETAMSGAEATLEVLRVLRAIGVQVAIDDFGTGYSSLHYLARLPADALKVDRSFVDGIGADPRKTRVVSTIVDLADSLGMAVVAEGVETRDQLAWLKRLGIRSGQGWHLGEPAPPEVLHTLTGIPTESGSGR